MTLSVRPVHVSEELARLGNPRQFVCLNDLREEYSSASLAVFGTRNVHIGMLWLSDGCAIRYCQVLTCFAWSLGKVSDSRWLVLSVPKHIISSNSIWKSVLPGKLMESDPFCVECWSGMEQQIIGFRSATIPRHRSCIGILPSDWVLFLVPPSEGGECFCPVSDTAIQTSKRPVTGTNRKRRLAWNPVVRKLRVATCKHNQETVIGPS